MKHHPKLLTALLCAICFTSAGSNCYADDVYVADAFAVGPIVNPCAQFLWDADTVFYNTGATDATVTLIGVSNGAMRPNVPAILDLPHGRATSVAHRWMPANEPGLWIYHLNVPSNVQVDSELLLSQITSCAAPAQLQPYGKTRLPVFRTLNPPGQQQILTGITLGDLPARINIAVYNASNNVASATINIFRACDGISLDSRTATLQPNSVEQFGGFSLNGLVPTCPPFLPGLKTLAYALVTVDQPSLSFASILANGQVPTSSIQVAGAER